MKVEVLMSTMYQTDLSIVDKTGINTDVLLINQCDEDKIVKEKRSTGMIRCISTRERGLSRSRNKAIENARGDYCLICDDDEHLEKDYSQKIVTAFEQYKDADIIAFKVKIGNKKYPTRKCRIGYIKSLRVSSVQIALRLNSIRRAGIKFDTNFGSGTPLGSGEENIFMYECLKAGLKIYYVPVNIGEVIQGGESQWFKGFNEEYFFKRGKILNRMMGKVFAHIYAFYFLISKYSLYHTNISFAKAAKQMFKGMYER